MAEAFGTVCRDFELVTQIHPSLISRKRFDFNKWYGVRNNFKIVQIPLEEAPFENIYDAVRYPKFDEAAADYAQSLRPSVIYTRSENAGRICVNNGLPTIIETHIEPSNGNFKRVLAVKNRDSLLGVVTISSVLREMYIRQGLGENKILVWPDAVDVEAFNFEKDPNGLREKLGLRKDAFMATYCGHLYPNRGIRTIFETAKLCPEVTFLIVGGWEKDVEKRIHEARKISNVKFVGFVVNSDIAQYLKASNILLLPYSRNCETAEWMSPLKLFEYMASNRPIIASDLISIRQHLENGRSCLFADPDDSQSMRECILTLKSDVKLARDLARNAYKDVLPFTWIRRARDILSTFSQDVF